jgi:hypothetical protein
MSTMRLAACVPLACAGDFATRLVRCFEGVEGVFRRLCENFVNMNFTLCGGQVARALFSEPHSICGSGSE